MWQLTVPWWELVLRSIAVYVFLLVLLRMTGRRQVGQLSPFDLILLLVLSNAVQNSMNGGDNSLIGGLISAATLVTINYLLDYATTASNRLDRLIGGRPQILIRNGRLRTENLAAVNLSRRDINAALRKAGCIRIDEVRLAMLETNGAISVVLRKAARS